MVKMLCKHACINLLFTIWYTTYNVKIPLTLY